MSWIDIIPYAESTGRLRKAYDRVTGPNGVLDNILQSHSLRPHTLLGHMSLYKAVLHHTSNLLPVSLLETVGVYVSHLNDCAYCFDHHLVGLRRLLSDDARTDAIRYALVSGDLTSTFDAREQAILTYARKLTLEPANMTRDDVQALRAVGLTDGEVLEINQVTAYFAYANRTILGLGTTTEGDVLGLSPGESDDGEDWQHG